MSEFKYSVCPILGSAGAGDLGEYDGVEEAEVAARELIGLTLEQLRVHPEFQEYPDQTELAEKGCRVEAVDIERFTSEYGTDWDWTHRVTA